MSRRLDALDNLIMSFDQDDPVERVKEAMLSGNTKEASRLVDGLSIEQLEKLAETLGELGPTTSTDEYSASLEDSAEPQAKDKDLMVGNAAMPENTMGDERVNNTSDGAGVDDPSVKAASSVKNLIDRLRKKAEVAAEVGGESSADGGNADTVSSTCTTTKENPDPEGETGDNPDLGSEDIGKTAAHVRIGIRRALEKVAMLSVLNSGINQQNPYFNRSVNRKIEELATALSKNL